MAIAPKSLTTRGLLKGVLDSRGARLATDGLTGAAPDVDVGGIIGLLKIYKPWIPLYKFKQRFTNAGI